MMGRLEGLGDEEAYQMYSTVCDVFIYYYLICLFVYLIMY